jgi:hypothetical protein
MGRSSLTREGGNVGWVREKTDKTDKPSLRKKRKKVENENEQYHIEFEHAW